MSRHAVAGGNIAGLIAFFSELRQKALSREGKLYPLVVIQEVGLDGFWIGRALNKVGWIESHLVEAASIAMPRRRRRAKTDRIDGETLMRTLLGRTPRLFDGQDADVRRRRSSPDWPRAKSAGR